MKRIIFLFFVLLLLGGYHTRAQVSYTKRAGGSIGDAPKVNDLSNEARVDEVDHTSGTLKVTIPLYEVQAGDIRVPITLRYNAVGLKVNQSASAVGMGWELNAGGGITTVVNGFPDNSNKGIANSMNYNPMLGLTSTSNNLDLDGNAAHRQFAVDVVNGHADGAWDSYVYNLPTMSGKYTRNGANVLTYPFDPSLNFLSGMTDAQGIRYEFQDGEGKRVRRRTFYTEAIPPDTPRYTTDWKSDYYDYYDRDLSRMISARTNDTVTFGYDIININQVGGDALYRLNEKKRITTSVMMPVSMRVIKDLYGDWTISSPSGSGSYFVKEPNISQTQIEVIQHTRISQINFEHGRVRFIYGQDMYSSDKLDSIIVEKKTGSIYTTLRRIEFNYHIPPYAHYLTSILISDAQGNRINDWQFSYYDDYLPVSPRTETYEQDRWGFYNAKSSNKTLIEDPDKNLGFSNKHHYPIYNENEESVLAYYMPRNSREARYILNYSNEPYKVPFANRSFVFEEARKGTLKSVVTPTGATVEYEYEPHRFPHSRSYGTYFGSQTMVGGGFRVKTIRYRERDYNYVIMKKEYTYGSGNYDQPGYEEDGYAYVSYPATVLGTDAVYGNTSTSPSLTVKNLVFLSHPLNDMTFPSGAYAYYGTMNEYIVKDSLATNRYSAKTTYYNHLPSRNIWETTSSSPDDLPFPTVYVNSGVKRDALTGKPHAIVKYRSLGGGTYQKAEETVYEYQSFEAPAFSEPQKSYSFFGGTTGVLYAQFSSPSFMMCYSVYNPITGSYDTICDTFENAPEIIDPLYMCNITMDPVTTYFPGRYYNSVMDLADYSNVYKLVSEHTRTYSDIGSALLSDRETRYEYGNIKHLFPTKVSTFSSEGDSLIQRFKYPPDYPSPNPNSDISMLLSKNVISEPREKLKNIKIGGTEKVTGFTVNHYGASTNGTVYLGDTQVLPFGHPLAYSGFNGNDQPSLKVELSNDRIDEQGHVLEYTFRGGAKNSQIWGYHGSFVIAGVTNAAYPDIAYSGFEGAEMGNWVYSGAPVTNGGAATGKQAYDLGNGALSKSGLQSASKYRVSYWYKTGATVHITGGTVSAEVIRQVRGSWKFAEREVSGTASVQVSGSGYVDDVGLCPVDAQMTTYTYEPMTGITSMTDAKGRTSFYEYDAAQRLWRVRDLEGNIVNQYEYNFYEGEIWHD